MGYYRIDNGLDKDFWIFTEECCKCKKNQHQHEVRMSCLNWDTWTWICSDCEKKDVVYFLPHETDLLL